MIDNLQPWHTPVIRPALDLTKYAFRQQHGDITVLGTWWLGDKDRAEGYWPCLVLVPTFRMMIGDSYVPCVVTLDLAWIWSEEHGDPAFALDTAMSFAQSLGLEVSRHTCFRILSIIRDHIEDLIKRIPPRPTSHQDFVADILITDKTTGRERHAEIKDDV
ncbi:hypothetical protein BRDID11004_47840 [Bradyrhizobium diazoefficiens]|uniref:Uncharacterized protein n=1 Tax=Bradyrhizobium diazoefficiens TaxID=1355477 RepID=A0A810A4R1_9BRAD|nr:hypothetical protein [Bradyrhizobium diazoefficiens]BBZ94313.1 hypothetical protein F07S3_41460 [Bradyrhizobium diazoefficiens]BCE56401.1 hypothetical protein XF5B_39130 [Bradyrhizobium diazoefficiens]